MNGLGISPDSVSGGRLPGHCRLSPPGNSSDRRLFFPALNYQTSNLREYFLASRNIPWWAAGISVFATLLSTNSSYWGSSPGGPTPAPEMRLVLIGGAAGMATALILLSTNGFQGVMDPLVTGINFFWVPGFSTAVSLMAGSLASRLFPAPDPQALKQLMVR